MFILPILISGWCQYISPLTPHGFRNPTQIFLKPGWVKAVEISDPSHWLKLLLTNTLREFWESEGQVKSPHSSDLDQLTDIKIHG